MWDTVFLMHMYQTSPAFFYNHQSDPAIREFRREADRLAADNEDLRRSQAELERQLATMTGEIDPNFLPAGINQSVVFAPSVVEAAVPALRVCAGLPDGTYSQFSRTLGRIAGNSAVTTVQTAGSVQNLQMIQAGDCDAALVQRDAIGVFDQQNPNSDLGLTRLGAVYNEDAHLFCSVESDVYHLADLDGRDDIALYVGPNGAGASVTWTNFASLDGELSGVSVVNQPVTSADFSKANTCALYVGRVGNAALTTLAGNRNARLVDIESVPVNELRDVAGEPLYHEHTIVGGTYAAQRGWNDTGFGTDTPTVNVPVDLVVADRWKEANASTGAAAALTEIQNLRSVVMGQL